MAKVLSVILAVPPSSPLCSKSGQTSVGGSAALKCSSSQGAPRPVYNWVRLGSFPTPSPGSMMQGKGLGHQGRGDSGPGHTWSLNSTPPHLSVLCHTIPCFFPGVLYCSLLSGFLWSVALCSWEHFSSYMYSWCLG